MNKFANELDARINELWEECKTPEWTQDKPTYNHRLFANMIVQECILVIEEEAEYIYAEGTIEAIVNLEKHFGVDS
jgi:hypothetical protein